MEYVIESGLIGVTAVVTFKESECIISRVVVTHERGVCACFRGVVNVPFAQLTFQVPEEQSTTETLDLRRLQVFTLLDDDVFGGLTNRVLGSLVQEHFCHQLSHRFVSQFGLGHQCCRDKVLKGYMCHKGSDKSSHLLLKVVLGVFLLVDKPVLGHAEEGLQDLGPHVVIELQDFFRVVAANLLDFLHDAFEDEDVRRLRLNK